MERLRLIYIAVGILYFLLPRDLVPDPVPLLGRLDDILLAFFLYRRYRRAKRATEAAEQPKEETRTGTQTAERESRSKTPYEVFGLDEGASLDEVEKRYRELMTQYHPDKVNHLGPELRELAHEKSIEIQSAYARLKEKG